MTFGATFTGSAGDDSISSIFGEPLVLVVMSFEEFFSAVGAASSTILIGILFRNGAPRVGLSVDEGVGVLVLATNEEPALVALGVTVVVDVTFAGEEVAGTGLVGGGLAIGSEGGFHIGPLGGTAYRVHKS